MMGEIPEPAHFPKDVSIILAEERHVREVAGLHHQYVANNPTDGMATIMRDVLDEYYHQLVIRNDCAVYVAVRCNQVVGYVSLVRNQRRVLLKSAIKRPFHILRVMTRLRFWPAMLRYCIGKISSEYLGGKWPKGGLGLQLDNAVELRSVAVSPEWRNRSVAVHLLQAAVQHATRKHWAPIVAWVAECNSASNKAFVKAGFRRAARRTDDNGGVSLYAWQPDTNAYALGPRVESIRK